MKKTTKMSGLGPKFLTTITVFATCWSQILIVKPELQTEDALK